MDPDPVIIFEHATLYNEEGEVRAEGDLAVDIDHAVVRRAGRDATVITYGGSLTKSLGAADQLAADGIDCEVIDLRT